MLTNSDYQFGIINGAASKELCCEMADWNYRYLGTMETTIELSEKKLTDAINPPALSIEEFWEDNKNAMIAYIEEVHKGVYGTVLNSLDNTPVWAEISIKDISKKIYTDPDFGDYYRLLLPGSYDITISARGYYTEIISEIQVVSETPTRVDTLLTPIYTISIDRNFGDILYNPINHQWSFSVTLTVDIDDFNHPADYIISESLPVDWIYQTSSSILDSNTTNDPVISGLSHSWSFSDSHAGHVLKYWVQVNSLSLT